MEDSASRGIELTTPEWEPDAPGNLATDQSIRSISASVCSENKYDFYLEQILVY